MSEEKPKGWKKLTKNQQVSIMVLGFGGLLTMFMMVAFREVIFD